MSSSSPSRVTCTAHTLNSGMPDTGSHASLVTAFASASPAQWNGMNTVSGRMLLVMRAGAALLPRDDVTRTWSPESRPSRGASGGCSSPRASGAVRLSPALRRVWEAESLVELHPQLALRLG